MPVNGQRSQLFLVGISVVCAEQKLSAVQLDPNVCLSPANVTAVVGYKLFYFSNVFHLNVSKHEQRKQIPNSASFR